MSIALIQRKTAQHFGIDVSDMLSFRRSRHLCEPRHLAIFIAHQSGAYRQTDICRAFERDPTSLRNAIRQIAGKLPVRADLRMALRLITAEVRPADTPRPSGASYPAATVEPLP